MINYILTFILLLNALFINHAYADGAINPSFDCKKALTNVEKEICSNEKLAELDKQVTKAFIALKKNPQERLRVSVHDLIKDQKAWLANRGKGNFLSEACSGQCLLEKYQARLDELTFPGASLPLTTHKMSELKNYFSDKSCMVLLSVTSSKIMHQEGLEEYACKLFSTDNQLANKLFSGCFGSNKDNFVPKCDYSTQIKKAVGLDEYTSLLSKLYDGGCGSLRYGDYAKQNAAILNALYYPQITDNEAKKSEVLRRFSLQGLWQKEKYQDYLQLKAKATKGLEQYYIHTMNIPEDQAKKLAKFYIAHLDGVYIGSHMSSHGDWNLTDVDKFLMNGTLPNNINFSYQYMINSNNVSKENAKPEILAYFLRLAVVNNYSKEAIEKIIAAGANLKSKSTEEYDTPLMNSVKRLDILKLLLDRGVDINAQNSFGKTALMYAIQYGSLDAVKILVEHHADVNLATFTDTPQCGNNRLLAGQRTPLMYAAWHANEEVINYLIAKGAKVDAKDTYDHDYRYYLSLSK